MAQSRTLSEAGKGGYGADDEVPEGEEDGREEAERGCLWDWDPTEISSGLVSSVDMVRLTQLVENAEKKWEEINNHAEGETGGKKESDNKSQGPQSATEGSVSASQAPPPGDDNPTVCVNLSPLL